MIICRRVDITPVTPPNSYGDVVTHNNAERLYVIGMEIVSAITFATPARVCSSFARATDTSRFAAARAA